MQYRQQLRSRKTAKGGPAAAKRCFMLTTAAKIAADHRSRPFSASATDATSRPAETDQRRLQTLQAVDLLRGTERRSGCSNMPTDHSKGGHLIRVRRAT
jgi:hypothetical protein